jgi:riboflavin-specific deaminase-like protein
LSANVLRLYPLPPRELVSPETMYEDLELPPALRRDPSRPYVLINMVSSLDGRATREGKAARIGSQTDRQLMRTLRSKADAVMIGANTLRAEKLSLGLDEPAGPQPTAIILTNTGNVPLESHLIRNEGQEVLVLVPEGCPEDAVRRLRRQGDVQRSPTTPGGAIDLEEALKVLKAERGVDLLLVEGGPTLNHSLISEQLADELFLTLAPKLLGGEGLTILSGDPLPEGTWCPDLLSLHVAGGELFLRYAAHG